MVSKNLKTHKWCVKYTYVRAYINLQRYADLCSSKNSSTYLIHLYYKYSVRRSHACEISTNDITKSIIKIYYIVGKILKYRCSLINIKSEMLSMPVIVVNREVPFEPIYTYVDIY